MILEYSRGKALKAKMIHAYLKSNRSEGIPTLTAFAAALINFPTMKQRLQASLKSIFILMKKSAFAWMDQATLMYATEMMNGFALSCRLAI